MEEYIFPGNRKLEYRYYNMPPHTGAFAFIGNVWGHSVTMHSHFHNCMEIGLCHSGEGWGWIERKRVHYQKGDLCVIPPYTAHGFAAASGTSSHWEWIMTDTEKMFEDNSSFSLIGKDPRLLIDQPQVSNLFHVCQAETLCGKAVLLLELFRQPRIQSTSIKGLMASFLTDYVQRIPCVSESLIKERKSCVRVMPAIAYIQEHFQEKLSVQDLASRCGLSEEQFRRSFRSVSHTTPLDYLNGYRIREACRLLQEANCPVGSIAQETGFSTPSTFNRQFAASTGVSPLKWREMVRGKQDVNRVESLNKGVEDGVLPF